MRVAVRIPAGILGPVLEAARRRWAGLSVGEDIVAELLLARRPPDGGGDTFDWIAGLQTADLVLAGACLAGDKVAIAALEGLIARIAEEVLARHPGGGLDRPELRQRLLRQLMVADGGPTALQQYAGRGSLEGFIRVTAVRVALHEARAHGREVALDPLRLPAAAAHAPELEQIRERYRAPFEDALRHALRALESRERNLLRLYYLERLPCERLAAMYGVHTATAWRWLGRATTRLHEDVARRLVELTGGSASEVESILRVVATQLEGSLGGALSRTE